MWYLMLLMMVFMGKSNLVSFLAYVLDVWNPLPVLATIVLLSRYIAYVIGSSLKRALTYFKKMHFPLPSLLRFMFCLIGEKL